MMGNIVELALVPFMIAWSIVNTILGAVGTAFRTGLDLTYGPVSRGLNRLAAKYPPVRRVFKVVQLILSPFVAGLRRLVNAIHVPAESCIRHLDAQARKLADDKDISEADRLLIKGELRKYAELIAPPKKYPTMYATIPPDIRRSIVSDGRIINGDAPAPRFAGATVTEGFIQTAWAQANKSAFVFAALLTAFCVVMSFNFGLVRAYTNNVDVTSLLPSTQKSTSVIDRMNRPERIRTLTASVSDIWNESDEKRAGETFRDRESNTTEAGAAADSVRAFSTWIRHAATNLISVLLTVVGAFFCSAILVAGCTRLVWISYFRHLVFKGADEAVSALRKPWREALQRWRWRLAEREMEYEAYATQVEFVTQVDRSPVIFLGRSLGLMEFRGHLLSAQQDQMIGMSLVDMSQHVEVLGGSGEGKSRNVYVPIVEQLLVMRKQGYPIALYATDDKGVIGVDILKVVDKVGIDRSEVIVIGTGPEDYRVDPLDGLTPYELSCMIASVAKQSGGESSDSFWPQAGSDLINQLGTASLAFECLPAGINWMNKHQIRSYSVKNILSLASHDADLEEMLAAVAAALRDADGGYRYISHLDKDSLHEANKFLVDNWLTMVDVTRMAIRQNVRNALAGFVFKDEIKEGFGTGNSSRLISGSELNSNKIKIVNISQIEHGAAGRLVAILLKTMFYRQARRAELNDPEFAKERDMWWFDPKIEPGCEKYFRNVFLADEFQGLVSATADGSGGIDDGNFWNVARSCGVSGIFLSQSVSAYRLAIGDKATDNMRRNWRSKIFLRTEDLDTIDEGVKLAGKVLRFQSMDWNHMESSVAVRRETGISAESLPPALVSRDPGVIPAIKSVFSGFGKDAFSVDEYDKIYEVDDRFIPNRIGGPQDNFSEVNNHAQAAAWRQEDRSAGVLQHGSSEAATVEVQDIMQMGRGRALCFIQRGGSTRCEFTRLTNG